jgi:hypothetical protein
MIGPMLVLRRIKQLKQDRALRALRLKRAEVDEATAATQLAHEMVQASAATLPDREDAIYAPVLGRVIDLGEVDETRGKVVQLEKEHALLQNDWERAVHIQHRLEAELEVVSARYRETTKAHDKYIIITDEMKIVLDETANAREEAEIEDIFARPRRRVA